MPKYKVVARGFHEGKLYDPEGKRRVLDTPTPFTKKNKIPSWLVEMPKESESVRKKRESQQASRDAANADGIEQDAKSIEEASFLGDGENAPEII